MRTLRKLTSEGIAEFARYLELLVADPYLPPPLLLLESPSASREIVGGRECPSQPLRTRREAAVLLDQVVTGLVEVNPSSDEGLWAWLTLCYFDSVCPSDDSGARDAGDSARYLLHSGNYQRYYRHLLAMPYRIYRAHRDNPARAHALLCGPVDSPGDLAEQISARQELVSNPSFVELVTQLYLDASGVSLKRGAGGSGPGSPRRLAAVAEQLNLTFDFYSLSADQISRLLPKEFDRYKRGLVKTAGV